jgi:flagellar protein FlgJ
MTTISPILPAPITQAPITQAPITQSTAPSAPAAGPATPDRARLHQAAQAFEAIFVRQMLASARQSNFGDSLWGNDQGQGTFAGMRDERLADLTAQSGALGLAQQIERQLGAVTQTGNAAQANAETRR